MVFGHALRRPDRRLAVQPRHEVEMPDLGGFRNWGETREYVQHGIVRYGDGVKGESALGLIAERSFSQQWTAIIHAAPRVSL